VSLSPTEANRDVLDWSGKKPLDYQKQLTSISNATFSSEYKVMSNVIISNIQTLPARQNTMKKNRNRERTGVQRSFSIMTDVGASSSSKSFDGSDTRSLAGGETESGFGTKRKEKSYRSSFLKKSMSRRK
jgi:hypothetical protein